MRKVGQAQYCESLERGGIDRDYDPVTEVVVKGIRNTLERFRMILGLEAGAEHDPEPGCGTDERRSHAGPSSGGGSPLLAPYDEPGLAHR